VDPLKIADRIWPITRNAMKLHTWAYRATGGRIGHRLPGLVQMLLLDHVGAKSGKKRTIPLLYTRDGDDFVIVGSKGGYPQHPAWFHNLRANPDTTIQVRSKRLPVHARVAGPEERARIWPMVVDVYGGYADYQRRTKREIPLIILEPRAA
jgi:deazaflavin-dependent oxidoreductase (nitroreductase family)